MSAPIDMLRALRQSKGEPSPGLSTAPLPSQAGADDTDTREAKPAAVEVQSQPVEDAENSNEPATQAPLADPAENR
jgi:hypothetical protein